MCLYHNEEMLTLYTIANSILSQLCVSSVLFQSFFNFFSLLTFYTTHILQMTFYPIDLTSCYLLDGSGNLIYSRQQLLSLQIMRQVSDVSPHTRKTEVQSPTILHAQLVLACIVVCVYIPPQAHKVTAFDIMHSTIARL